MWVTCLKDAGGGDEDVGVPAVGGPVDLLEHGLDEIDAKVSLASVDDVSDVIGGGLAEEFLADAGIFWFHHLTASHGGGDRQGQSCQKHLHRGTCQPSPERLQYLRSMDGIVILWLC